MLALGAAGMAQTYGEGSTQAAILCQLPQEQAAGVTISLAAADGTELFSHTATQRFSSMAFSSPELTQGEAYVLSVDGVQIVSFTLSQAQASVSADGTVSAYTGGGMGGFGGGGGRPGAGGGTPDGVVPGGGRGGDLGTVTPAAPNAST
jgi:hypothetical protein